MNIQHPVHPIDDFHKVPFSEGIAQYLLALPFALALILYLALAAVSGRRYNRWPLSRVYTDPIATSFLNIGGLWLPATLSQPP